MTIEDINNATWGCLINDPKVIFRITFINANNTIEYRLKNDNTRYSALLSEIQILEEKDVPNDLKDEYDEAVFLDL